MSTIVCGAAIGRATQISGTPGQAARARPNRSSRRPCRRSRRHVLHRGPRAFASGRAGRLEFAGRAGQLKVTIRDRLDRAGGACRCLPARPRRPTCVSRPERGRRSRSSICRRTRRRATPTGLRRHTRDEQRGRAGQSVSRARPRGLKPSTHSRRSSALRDRVSNLSATSRSTIRVAAGWVMPSGRRSSSSDRPSARFKTATSTPAAAPRMPNSAATDASTRCVSDRAYVSNKFPMRRVESATTDTYMVHVSIA